jgi:protein O-GlcNAc transferase
VAKKPKKPKKDRAGTSRQNTGLKATSSTANAEGVFGRACELHQRGLLTEAEEAYRQCVRLNPQVGVAWRNLGALLRKRGAFAEGRHCTEQALKLNPDDASLWGNFGNVLRDLGLFDESLKAFAEGQSRAPENLAMVQGKAITLNRAGRLQEVVQLLSPWLEEIPPEGGSNALSDLLLELGNAHHALHNRELALRCWKQGALSAEGQKRLMIGLNTAQVLCEQQRFEEAGGICQELRPLFPYDAKLVYAEAMVAKGLGQVERAIGLFDQALKIQPDYPICLNSYGLLLREIGRSHQARHCFEEALKHDPGFGAAMNNLGSVLKDVSRYEEALIWLRKGAKVMQDSPAAHSNVLFTLVGYELEGAEECYAEAKRYAAEVSKSAYPRCNDRIMDPDPNRVLRIGLVSPDLCRHAVSYFIEPLLEYWDRKQLHITLYACGEQHDDYTSRLQTKGDQWRDLRGQSDETMIAQIQRDEIDILIDLAGHTAGNRLPVFAAKPAPIQATYLGYYGTTGLDQVDYWMTDAILHPPECEQSDPASEERWRLNRCYVCYRPLPDAPDVAPLPCKKTGVVSFGSFNQSRKITHATACHWMAVMNAVPGSKLVLKSKNLGEPNEQERVMRLFGELGLATERLRLLGHSASVKEHLDAYRLVDIALDTYPYTGCTTTADALWMGVPVLTVSGRSMVSRQAAAVLTGAGHPEWICKDVNELSAKAKQMATNITQLAELRASLREQVARSQLLDAEDLAQCTQRAFRRWWKSWLVNNGWNVEPGRQTKCWEETEPVKHCLDPVKNSPRLEIPLWKGEMPLKVRAQYQRDGYVVCSLQSLSCWQGATELFERTSGGIKLVAEANELCSGEEEAWKSVYPQLLWRRVN